MIQGNFVHNFIELEKLELKLFDDGKKHYVTSQGNYYPSITQIINDTSDKTELEKWKKRVGEEEAKKISVSSIARGKSLHSALEGYVYNKEIDPKKILPINFMMFKQIQKVLDEHVDTIYGIESRIYSDKLKVYGKSDLIADYDGKHSLIDFKNSKRLKKEEYIISYCIQETFYSCCLMEKYNFKCENIITLIANEEDDPQIFKYNVLDFLPLTIQTIKKYYNNKKTT